MVNLDPSRCVRHRYPAQALPSSSFAPVQFGKYTLVERIASGGMAEVYKAVMRGAAGFEKTVALKRILPRRPRYSGFDTS